MLACLLQLSEQVERVCVSEQPFSVSFATLMSFEHLPHGGSDQLVDGVAVQDFGAVQGSDLDSVTVAIEFRMVAQYQISSDLLEKRGSLDPLAIPLRFLYIFAG